MATSILGQTAVRAAKLEVVTELPKIGKKNQIYLVPNKSSVSGDVYDEYIWINNTWEFLGNKRLELTIDYFLKPDSTNPVENRAIYSRFLDFDKNIEVNKNNIDVLTGRVNGVDGIAKGAEELAKVNEKRINGVQATADTAFEYSRENQNRLTSVQATANEAKALVEGLTTVVRGAENNISQLKEFNVVYPNNLRKLTVDSTPDEIKKSFIPEIGGTPDTTNTPHVGYLIKGSRNSDRRDDPDSTIISVEIVKIDNKDCHKFMYIDNNRDLVTMTVYLVDITDCKVIERSVVSNINTIVDKINTFDKKLSSGTLRDLYISAGAKYNEQTGYYELNGLTDITEEEMRVIWQENLSGWYLNGRTNLTKNIAVRSNSGGYNGGIDISNICNNNSNITKFNFGSPPFAHFLDNAFSGCTKLETIDTRFPITPYLGIVGPNIFRGCLALKEVRFNMKYLRSSTNVNFPVSSLISKASILSIIETTPTTGSVKPLVVVGLNETAYNRLKDDTDITAALTEKNGFVTLTQI